MKIAYIFPTFEVKGGAERIIVEKANYFSTHMGFDVYIVTQYQHNDAPNAYPLSNKIHQINLGIPIFLQYKFNYPKRLWIKWQINKRLRKETTDAILNIDPDILIGIPYFKPNIVCQIPCRAKKIIEVHEPREYLKSDFFNGSLLSKLIKIRDIHIIEKKADAVVGLTNGAKKEWKKARRVEVIPNFTSMKISQQSTCNAKRVIAVGRLVPVKGFERLIRIWKIVSTKYPDWQLDIFGDGYLKSELLNLIHDYNLNNLTLHEVTPKISQEYSNSSICAVTSYYEGFSLVILEAMTHGVPCVAFDCPEGPRSIIKDNLCGYLIEEGNCDLFAEKLCDLIENQQLRKQFSDAAIERSKTFDIKILMGQWKSLFESLTKDTSD